MAQLGVNAGVGAGPNLTPPPTYGIVGGAPPGTQLGAGGGGSGGPMGSGNQTPNFFGSGMYQAPTYNIQQGAFNNPGFQLGAYNNAANNYINNAVTNNQVTAAQAAAGNYGNYNTGTQGQLGLAQQYAQMAAGNGPSLASVTAQQQGAANLAASESMLGSARGAGSPGAAQMAARGAAASGQNQIAQNAVLGRTQEEMGALGAEGGLYGNIAGQGLQQVGLQQGLSQFNAGQQNQVAQGNQANALAGNTNYLNSLSTQSLAQQQGQIAGQQLGVQQQLGLGQIGENAYSSAAGHNQQIAGSIMSGAGAALGALALL